MSNFLQDVTYSLRTLLKKPGFTLVVVLTLALGIGANTAIFSVVNAVLLKPLPYKDPEQLVMVQVKLPQGQRFGVSYPDLLDWQEQSTHFTGFSIWTSQSVNLTGQEEPTRVRGGFVSASFFDIMQTDPFIGRGFLPDEDQTGTGYVTVLNYGVWQNRFGGDPDLVGKQLILNGESFTVVGIMPEHFQFPRDEIEVWIPFQHWPNYNLNRKNFHGAAIGRIQTGVSMAEAQTEMETIAARLQQQYPATNEERGVTIVSLKETVVRDTRTTLYVLLGAVGFVLLIACANVANLLFARSVVRQKEIAMRTALGAGRGRLIRQLLTETMLLALMGGGLGLLLGAWGIDILTAINPRNLPGGVVAVLDTNVFVFTLAISLCTGLLFGLLPAFKHSKVDLNELLKDGIGTSSGGVARSRSRNAMVVAQMALALVLLAGAGLMIQSFWNLMDVDTGFQRESLLTMEYRLPQNKYPERDQQWRFHYEVGDRIRALPGVVSASNIRALPFSGNRSSSTFSLPGQPPALNDQAPPVQYNVIDPYFFKTIGIPLLQGRGISDRDQPETQEVVVINRTMAERHWPNESPIGKSVVLHRPFSRREEDVVLTIVGVVGDITHLQLDEPKIAQMYLPYTQHPHIFSTIVVRTAGDPMAMASVVKEAVWSVDPDQPMWKVRTVEFLIERSLGDPRFIMQLLSGFAVIALLLASIGIYGVISYAVNQRIREIGIRIAIGAQSTDIFRLVVGHGMLMTVIGIGIGLALAVLVTRFMETLLYNVNPADPAVLGSIAVVLATVAFLACYLPARRATRVNPIRALRYE